MKLILDIGVYSRKLRSMKNPTEKQMNLHGKGKSTLTSTKSGLLKYECVHVLYRKKEFAALLVTKYLRVNY